MAIIAITVGAQIIIVNFGGIVFRLQPLDLVGWAVSIALGTGSIIVGYVLRLLPDIEIPLWLLGGSNKNSAPQLPESAPKIVINPLVEVPKISDLPSKIAPKSRWDEIVHKTRLQNRVVKVFQLPSSHSLENIAKKESLQSLVQETHQEPPVQSAWERLRLYVYTIAAFRHQRSGATETLLIDPRKYHNARVQLAKQRSKNDM